MEQALLPQSPMVGVVSLSDDDPRPPYEQIADDLRGQIMSGAYAVNKKLPSTRELMEHYDVANQTVQRAMGILRTENLIHSVAGRGTYVRDVDEQDGGAVAGSSQYDQIMARLDSIAEGMSQLDDRLTELEAEKSKPARKSASTKARSSRSNR